MRVLDLGAGLGSAGWSAAQLLRARGLATEVQVVAVDRSTESLEDLRSTVAVAPEARAGLSFETVAAGLRPLGPHPGRADGPVRPRDRQLLDQRGVRGEARRGGRRLADGRPHAPEAGRPPAPRRAGAAGPERTRASPGRCAPGGGLRLPVGSRPRAGHRAARTLRPFLGPRGSPVDRAEERDRGQRGAASLAPRAHVLVRAARPPHADRARPDPDALPAHLPHRQDAGAPRVDREHVRGHPGVLRPARTPPRRRGGGVPVGPRARRRAPDPLGEPPSGARPLPGRQRAGPRASPPPVRSTLPPRKFRAGALRPPGHQAPRGGGGRPGTASNPAPKLAGRD